MMNTLKTTIAAGVVALSATGAFAEESNNVKSVFPEEAQKKFCSLLESRPTEEAMDYFNKVTKSDKPVPLGTPVQQERTLAIVFPHAFCLGK